MKSDAIDEVGDSAELLVWGGTASSLGICLLASDPADSLKAAMELAQHRAHLAETLVHGPADREENRMSGGVGPLQQMDGTMAAFSQQR